MADFMALTPQFRALAKLSMLAASVWAVIGGLLGAFRGAEIIGESPLAAALRFGAMYAMVGAISGIVTSLLVARAERKRSVGELHAGRMAAWGVLGGLAPPTLFGTLGLLAGAPLMAVLPLAGLGIVSGALGGVGAASAVTAAKRAALREPTTLPPLR